MKLKTMLVGEAPARGYDGQPAFSSSSGARITKLLGVDLHEVFQCVNLLPKWPGAGRSKGAAFPMAEAREAANRVLERLDDAQTTRRLLLAGWRVAQAFQLNSSVEYLRWYPLHEVTRAVILTDHRVAVIPHPSGVNRWWNELDSEIRAQQFLLDEARLTGRLPR